MTGPFDFIIFGAGGFGREVAWLISETYGHDARIAFLVDVDNDAHTRGIVAGRPVINVSSLDLAELPPAVVAIGDPESRSRVVQRLSARGGHYRSLIDRDARVSTSVAIGEGSIVCAGSIATVDISIGVHVHINLNCTIGHDVTIGDFATLSPGVHVSGNVEIGSSVFVGTGACIINGKADRPLRVGAGATIAAGAVVVRDVEPGALVAGVPAVVKR